MVPKLRTLDSKSKNFTDSRMIIDCGQSIFYFDLVRGVHAHVRRKKRGEKRAFTSRAFSHARGHLRVSRVLFD